MPSAPFDPRLTPARADLAAERLRGLVDAPRYAKGRRMRIVAASAPLRRSPQADASLETEALHGESVRVYDEQDGWAWAQLDRDLYVGYLPTAALGAPTEPSHRVAALRTHAYPDRAIKLPPRMALSLGAQLRIVADEGDFAVTGDGLYLWSRHLAEIGAREADPVAVAELFLETPYLWGGRTSEGIDCSGLVQTALTAAGVASPRDTDMMEATLGQPTAIDDPEAPLARGDLVFWKGHIGVMRDPVTLLHANGWHMKTVSEPLQQARDRIAANGGGEITSVKRLGITP
ncbi:MAG TPA: NlpC/P60 family protein [Roseiarcus sp.]|nr:NlpC/P60 family protein [Roseiarcus sp.]